MGGGQPQRTPPPTHSGVSGRGPPPKKLHWSIKFPPPTPFATTAPSTHSKSIPVTSYHTSGKNGACTSWLVFDLVSRTFSILSTPFCILCHSSSSSKSTWLKARKVLFITTLINIGIILEISLHLTNVEGFCRLSIPMQRSKQMSHRVQ